MPPIFVLPLPLFVFSVLLFSVLGFSVLVLELVWITRALELLENEFLEGVIVVLLEDGNTVVI